MFGAGQVATLHQMEATVCTKPTGRRSMVASGHHHAPVALVSPTFPPSQRKNH